MIINYLRTCRLCASGGTLTLGIRDITGGSQLKSINMTKVKEIYLCEICGNKVQVLESDGGQLVCCGQPMKKVAK